MPHHGSLDALLADAPPPADAVALYRPPQVRYDLARVGAGARPSRAAEKPPGATLFAAWHSRFAAGVESARAWLRERRIDRVSIVWREDVRVWHPGQAWIWEPGGFGVFDPGINALSIVTQILPQAFSRPRPPCPCPPTGRPIAADLIFRDTAGAPITMDLDWRQAGPQSRDIVAETEAGTLALANGGAVLTLPTGTDKADDREYPASMPASRR